MTWLLEKLISIFLLSFRQKIFFAHISSAHICEMCICALWRAPCPCAICSVHRIYFLSFRLGIARTPEMQFIALVTVYRWWLACDKVCVCVWARPVNHMHESCVRLRSSDRPNHNMTLIRAKNGKMKRNRVADFQFLCPLFASPWFTKHTTTS